ncbi:MAG TPA: nucleotide disphospho-sugar-binding domain-containing protein [Solirubrobacterales bacterium]|nr:nucleotide disphospho-sugar-binding domain-containing protein [Solirubrobacterales bacterium]
MPILDELRRRGHEVVLRTLAKEVEAMRSRGFEAEAISPEIEALAMEDWRARTVVGGHVKGMRTLRARARHDSRDLRRALAEVQPETLIVDVLATGALGAAASWDRPWACYRPFPLPKPRLAFKLLGIAAPASAARLHLYPSAEPFENRRRWPEGLVMVGPCAWEPPGKLPAALTAVEKPLVLVTTSTEFQDDGRLAKTALEALAEESLHVVATLPSVSPDRFEVPANATVLRFAPHTSILSRAVCAVTHGGMGATQKALAMGVPVCAVPFGRDQPQVARRVEAASAGTRLPASRLNPQRLRTKVREAIACRSGAERIAQAFAAAGGAALAADEIEQRLL